MGTQQYTIKNSENTILFLYEELYSYSESLIGHLNYSTKRKFTCNDVAKIANRLTKDVPEMKEAFENILIKIPHLSVTDINRELRLHTSPSNSSIHEFHLIENVPPPQLPNHPYPLQNIQDIMLSSYRNHRNKKPSTYSTIEKSVISFRTKGNKIKNIVTNHRNNYHHNIQDFSFIPLVSYNTGIKLTHLSNLAKVDKLPSLITNNMFDQLD